MTQRPFSLMNLLATVATAAILASPVAAAPIQPPSLFDAPPTAITPDMDGLLRDLRAGDDVEKAQRFVESFPDSAVAHEVLGIAQARAGDLEAAETSFKKAVELDPNQFTALTKLGDVSIARNEFVKAAEFLRQALDIAPDDRLSHQRLGYIYDMAMMPERAIEHYEKGLVGTADNYVGVKIDLAALYNARGDYQRSLELLGHFAEAQPPAFGSAAIVAEALTATDRADEAEALLQRAAPSDFIAAAALARLQTEQGDLAAAETTLVAAVEARPNDPELAFQLGALRGLQRDYEGAVEAFEAGLAVAPENAALLRGAMRAEAQLGQTEKALEYGERLAALGGAQDIFLLADMQDRLGNDSAAEAGYRAVLEQDSVNVPALNNLALLLMAKGETDEAVTLARRSAEAAPDTAAVQDTLGQTLMQASDASAAVSAFERAVALAPDRTDYRDRLEQARNASGG